jgi:hypothetical protein
MKGCFQGYGCSVPWIGAIHGVFTLPHYTGQVLGYDVS